jgi:hypothetical protein
MNLRAEPIGTAADQREGKNSGWIFLTSDF